MLDATDTLDQADTITSNVAAFLRAALDAGEDGVRALLEHARPYAEQLDAIFGSANSPIVEGPLPADRKVDDQEAASALGIS